MTKSYLSLGLMSGTSGDGVDASLIRSTGSLNENNSYEVIVDKYFEYDQAIFKKIYQILGEDMGTRIHAFSMKTYTQIELNQK